MHPLYLSVLIADRRRSIEESARAPRTGTRRRSRRAAKRPPAT